MIYPPKKQGLNTPKTEESNMNEDLTLDPHQHSQIRSQTHGSGVEMSVNGRTFAGWSGYIAVATMAFSLIDTMHCAGCGEVVGVAVRCLEVKRVCCVGTNEDT